MGDKAQYNFLLKTSREFQIKPRKIIYSGAAIVENDFANIFPSSEFHTTDIAESGKIDKLWIWSKVQRQI